MNNDIFQIKEITPEEENILNAFRKDTVNRVDFVISMYEMINRSKFGVSSISIDGQWGSGKTFFVKMLMDLIIVKTKSSKLTSYQNELSKIEEIVNLSESKIIPLYYDAWENDLMSEPILSLIYSICKQTGTDSKIVKDIEEISKTMTKHFGHFLLKILSTFTAIPDLSALADSICKFFNSNEPFIPVINTEELKNNINELLEKILNKTNKPIVIFIDELDRCKPTFAIQLLESIKHYFFNEKILFVFSVNIEELQHSIRSIYGQGFDATRYLDRFFNIRFNLPQVDIKNFLEKEFLVNTYSDTLTSVILGLSEIYDLQLREIIKFNNQVHFVSNCPYYDSHDDDKTNNGYAFTSNILIPLAICLKFKDQSKFHDFITGKGEEILRDLFSYDLIKKIYTFYFNNNEENLSDDILLLRLIQAYQFIFSKKRDEIRFGKITFNEKCFKIFNNKVSLLG